MRFKLLGVLLVLLGAYLAIDALVMSEHLAKEVRAEVYLLVVIALLQTVRILQAERHYREQQKR